MENYNFELIKTLLKEGYSLQEICEQLKYTYHNVYYHIKKDAELSKFVSRKKNGSSITTLKARTNKRKIKPIDFETVQKLYIHDKKSLKDIAKIYNCSPATVFHFLKNENIPLRLKSGNDEYVKPKLRLSKKDLTKLYYVDKLSLSKIAKKFGYSHSQEVALDMDFYNLTRRSYKEASDNMYVQDPTLRDRCVNHFFTTDTKYPSYNTSLEKSFMVWAKENNIEYEQQFQIPGYYHRYDFLILNTKILIEMDGSYWHSLPYAIEHDPIHDFYAQKSNYMVIRISDEDVKRDKNVFDIIKEELKNAN